MASPEVLVEDRGSVRWLTLNRPEARNAQNAALLRALEQALLDTAQSDDVRAVVLAGAGNVFSAGHDIKEVVNNAEYRRNTETAEGRFWQELDLFVRPVRLLRELRIPTIARVQGPCVAAALMLVTAADLVVASDDATFYSHVTRDMGAADVETPTLAWAVGERVAKQLLWTSDVLDAAAALRAGLVNWVVPRNALDEKIDEVTGRILAIPREALALSKMSFRFMEDRRGRKDAEDYHFMAHQLSHQTSDARALFTERIRELEARD